MLVGMIFVLLFVIFVASTEMLSFRLDKFSENLLYVQDAKEAPEASEVLQPQKPLSNVEESSEEVSDFGDDLNFDELNQFIVTSDTAPKTDSSSPNTPPDLDIDMIMDSEIDDTVGDFFEDLLEGEV